MANISILHMKRQAMLEGADMKIGYERDADKRANEATLFLERGLYEYVGDIETDSLEEAWQLTNNIDSRWIDGDKVHHLQKPDGCRSSMVGDIFLMDAVAYVVGSFGFKKMEGVVQSLTDEATTRLFG